MTTKVVHCKKEKYDVYIGRPSIWGNPFSWKEGTLAKYQCKDREDSLRLYKEYALSNPEIMRRLPELKEKVLGCWCKPLACHGDILAELIEEFVP